MIGGKIIYLKNIEMTLDTMCNNLIYWSQELYENNLLKAGSHILAMTSVGGRKKLAELWRNISCQGCN